MGMTHSFQIYITLFRLRLYQELKWGSCPYKYMHTDQILNDPLASGKPEFSQTQPGHDLGVRMDHRPLPAWAVWTWMLSLCLRLVRDLYCMDATHVVAGWVRARKLFVY